LEAAVYGIPILFGPNFRKFREAHELIAAGGAFSLANDNDFKTQMERLIADPDLWQKTGYIVASYVKQNSGVTDQILKELQL
jgi:3-deoxy-D-manno-octulosonic-acid transferase